MIKILHEYFVDDGGDFEVEFGYTPVSIRFLFE